MAPMKILLLISAVVGCSALPTFLNGTEAMFPTLGAKPESCVGWDWFYCPRDPGCTTYAMSAHQVSVGLAPSRLNVVAAGRWVNLYVIGTTNIKNVSQIASYKVYGIDGKNVATGTLAARHGMWYDGPKKLGASLELNYEKKPNHFRLQIPMIVAGSNFEVVSGKQFVNFGMDIFLKGSAASQAMCVQIANKAYSNFESSKAGFQMECKDNGDGSFTPGATPDIIHPLSGCNEIRGAHHQCGGCLTYCNPQFRTVELAPRNPDKK